jgi:hypothetical protein
LLGQSHALPKLVQTGCLFVTSAVESLDDEVLRKLDKGHTRADFLRALGLCANSGLTLQPTFVPFTPWTTRDSYLDLLETVAERGLIPAVPSIQLAIRLLIPSRSRLLELPEIARMVGAFDAERLVYPWDHPDPAVDDLATLVFGIVAEEEKRNSSRATIFERIWLAASKHQPSGSFPLRVTSQAGAVPHLSEPWYC